MRWFAWIGLAVLALGARTAWAEEAPSGTRGPPSQVEVGCLQAPDQDCDVPRCCLPIPKPRPLPVYGGCLFKRRTITGDWGGTRTDLASRGLTTGLRFTHVTQGLLSGGVAASDEGPSDWATVLRATLDLHFNTERAGLWRGGSFLLRGHGRTGEALQGRLGSLSVVNTVAAVPLPDPDVEILAVGALIYRQWFTGQFSVHVGLLDNLDRDLNVFAWGDGSEQFLNFALTVSQMYNFVMRPTPLGLKLNYLPTGKVKDIAIRLTVGSGNDMATLSTAPEGVFVHGEVGFGYTHKGLPGRHKFGVTYGWNPEYPELERDFPGLPPGTLEPDKSHTWSVDHNWWHYFDTYPGRKRKGWGAFSRLGLSDGDPNPYHVSVSGGFGGDVPWRPQDGFGIGGYWTKVSSASSLLPLGNEYGFEAFYRVGFTPWFHFTLDIQTVRPALDSDGTKVIFGVRTHWKF